MSLFFQEPIVHDTKSLPTYPVRTFVKQILVLFATVLILIPEVYAEDSWYVIDGITLRISRVIAQTKVHFPDHDS